MLENKDKVKTICLHHEQFFGKVFERKADKCCGVLKSHRVKAKGHTLIDLEMAKLLKSKGFKILFLMLKYETSVYF